MRILIIGAGDIGFQLSKRLSREHHDITMIDMDPDKVQRASEQLDAFVIEGSGISYETLQKANLGQMDIVAAVTDRDAVNLMACRIAKKVGVPTTIARVRSPEFTSPDFILTPAELGVDCIIHPEIETAHAVVQLIHQSNATYAFEFEGGKIQLLGVQIEQDSPLLRIPLVELGEKYGNPPMRIVAIDRNHKALIPAGHNQLLPGDQAFVVCSPEYTSEFLALAGKKDIPIHNIMILGGGLIGQAVAKSLDRTARVKLVEGNLHKCELIADRLSHALVIHGDGTDFDLLLSEDLTEMDAFIALTGNDENNLITTLLAHQANVPRAIALVNKIEYLPITPMIGMDAVVSKQLLTVNAVQRFIHRQDVASIARLPGIEAQFIEYIARPGSKITRRPLKNIRFPRDASVGAVLRGDELLIPQGDTRIQPEDKVVVSMLPHALSKVERLFQ